jgi:hypothetical protein
MKARIAVLSLCVLPAITVAPGPVRADAPQTRWKITGQLEEACSCNGACPCWFGNKPTRMTCGGGQVLFIEKGTYGKVTLDGLAFGGFVETPPGKTMGESFGNWTFAYLYVDEKADPEQRKALVELSHSIMPIEASTNQKVLFVPITRATEGKEHKIAIGSVGKFSAHLLEGGLGGTPTITDPPDADPIHHEYKQGETTSLTYTDAGQDWKFDHSNYMFGTFTTDNVEWAKYQARMAQRMEAMKIQQDLKKK